MEEETQLIPLTKIDVVILCGGLGSRLRSIIADRQKVLAPVGGKPFLDILVEDLIRQGFQRIIFCVGHMKDGIVERYSNRGEMEYLFSEELAPLGTGGAIQNALPLIRSNPFLIMNGDSRCEVNFSRFLQFHLDRTAAVSMVLVMPNGRKDGGMVVVDEDLRIRAFTEKSVMHAPTSLINAGIYLVQADALKFDRSEPPFSLEYDILPTLVTEMPCYGFVVKSDLVDIGTPERYQKANFDYILR